MMMEESRVLARMILVAKSQKEGWGFGYWSRKFAARKLQVKATMNLAGKRKFCG